MGHLGHILFGIGIIVYGIVLGGDIMYFILTVGVIVMYNSCIAEDLYLIKEKLGLFK